MEILSSAIPEVRLLRAERFGDARGWFSETWNRRRFEDAGIALDFVQDNQSHSAEPGTLRGLHFQTPPYAQSKLVRVLKGAVLDVAVDLRCGSPTYKQHVAVELSAENGLQILIPHGFAHGFLTLTADTEVLYKVDAYYAPEHNAGIAWDDPEIAIPWPVDPQGPVLSEKDRRLPRLAAIVSTFTYRPATASRPADLAAEAAPSNGTEPS